MRPQLAILLICVWAAPVRAEDKSALRARNIVVVTLDGFRWQEFFGGADVSLMDKKAGGVRDLVDLTLRFGRASAEERRAVLLPFFWKTIAAKGQIFGDRSRKAPTQLTNGLKFSYPGYSEMFCGLADPEIDSNAKKPNRNLSVLEFLNARPEFKGRVAAFCTWDVFPSIFRSKQNGLPVHTGWRPIADAPLNERQRMLNELLPNLPRYWPDNCFDFVHMELAREHLVRHKPRVLYVGLGETDEWGHGRRYDLYLNAAHNADRYLAALWQTLQEMPEYRDQTALIVTTDHGRGDSRANWTDHGKDIPSAEFIWMAVMGPDTPPLGVRAGVETTQSQFAASIAHLVDEDFTSASPRAASPLPGIRTK